MKRSIICLSGILSIAYASHAMETTMSVHKVLAAEFERERKELQIKWESINKLCKGLNNYSIDQDGTNARNPYTGRPILLELINLFVRQDHESYGQSVRDEIKEFIRLLINRDADVNGHDNFGNVPSLCAATSIYSDQVLPLLFGHGAHLNYQHPTTGQTTLMITAIKGCIPSVILLMRHQGIARSLTNSCGKTAADQVEDILRALPPQKEDYEYIYQLLTGQVLLPTPIS